MHDARYTGSEKMIKLRVMTPHRFEMDIRLPESSLVEELIAATNLPRVNLHAYCQGTKMREGRRLSEYKLPDGARIEIRTFPSSFSIIVKFHQTTQILTVSRRKLSHT
jgi:hypothetical protein